VTIDAQGADAPLSVSAIFLIVTTSDNRTALAQVCSTLGGLNDLIKTVGFRDLSGRLSCICRYRPSRRPMGPRPFARIEDPVHVAPATT
ncbi:MAG: Dyp-type peroxidase, partial [Bryobacteraceae bacterium]